MRRELPPGGPAGDSGREVREEIDFYLDERAKELEAAGLSPEEARREAARAFGDVDRIARRVHRIRRRREREEGVRKVTGSIVRDLRMAFRGLGKHPGFSAVVIGTLALGIGAVTAVFTVVNATLLRALPFDDADRLVFVQGAYDASDGPAIRGASIPEAADWEQMSRSFEAMAPVDNTSVNLTGDGGAERLSAQQVGEGFFPVLRVEPLLGRTFTPEEATPPGDHRVAVLSEALWTRRYARDRGVLERTIELNGEPVQVVGVLPEGFRGTSLQADIWLPMGNPLVGPSADRSQNRGSRWLGVVARLAPDVALEQAREEMAEIAARLEELHPRMNEDRIALVTPFRDVYMGSTDTLFLVVLGATGLLLVIAGANVANLLLVRALGRGGEIRVRKALGAGRARLLGKFLIESLTLTGLGAVLGLGLGVAGSRALAAVMPPSLLPAYVELTPDLTVFLVAAGLLAVTGILAGLAPALLASGADPAPGLRGEGGGTGAGRSSRLQSALVVGEVALALLLLVGAGLMTRSFRAQLAVSPGFDAEELFAFRVTLPADSYEGDALQTAVREIDRRLEAVPGVSGATFGSDAPLRGSSSASYIYLEGASAEDRIRFYIHRVPPDWFETLGTRIVQGRALAVSDLENPNVTVIGRALAERFFPNESAVGQSLRLFRPEGDRIQIVGVAEDVRYRDLTSDLTAAEDDPDIYVTWDSLPSRTVEFVVRAEANPARLEATVRDVVGAFDPELPVYLAQPLDRNLRGQTAQTRFGTLLLGGFGALATFLAVIGLYGVLSFTVDRRRREIAVRMAVGAEASSVRTLVVGGGLKLALSGLLLGLVASVLASRSLEAFLYGVQPVDIRTYGAVALLMLAVAVSATWLPALRATRIDPQKALKVE